MSGPPEARGAGTSPLIDRGRDRLLLGLYQLGWRVAHRLPSRLVRKIIRLMSAAAVRQNGCHVATLRRNLAILTGGQADDDLARRAVASHLRNVVEMLALPGWSAHDIRSRVRAINEPVLRTAYAGPGAVVALPHSGNWDLAGAWACLTGMPVTTVAEQLAGRQLPGLRSLPGGPRHGGALPSRPAASSPNWSPRSAGAASSACWPIATWPGGDCRCDSPASRSPCRPARRSWPGGRRRADPGGVPVRGRGDGDRLR